MAENVLLTIARCPVVAKCLQDPELKHPCSTIVRSQRSENYQAHQLPEPWSGQIDQAPILFISSNPSLSGKEVFPTGSWDDAQIVDYFQHRFGGGEKVWVKAGTKSLTKDGSYKQATMFWAGVKQRAKELLQREPQPGLDYALTEIVHCKSKSEHGVMEARGHCISRYFARVLSASPARVFVVLGSQARNIVQRELEIGNPPNVIGPCEVFGRERIIAFLPHPNARQKRTFQTRFSFEELEKVRSFLQNDSLCGGNDE